MDRLNLIKNYLVINFKKLLTVRYVIFLCLATLLTSCQFILKQLCISSIKKELGISSEKSVPPNIEDYCNCRAKWKAEGYSNEKAEDQCEECLKENY